MRGNLSELIRRLQKTRNILDNAIQRLTEEDANDYRVIEGAQDAIKGVQEIDHYSKQNAEAAKAKA